MSRKNVICKRGYEHRDFNDLLSELQGNHSCNVIADGIAAVVVDKQIMIFPVRKESEDRHRIMSNPKVKYLYSKHSNVIHDKHCECAKAIADEDLEWSNEYISVLFPCSTCMIQAYIAAGAKDPEEINTYLHFFEKTKMTDDQIRNIYVENEMKTRIFHDTMTVWHKEDTWCIKALLKKGHVQLYHNNYVIRKNGVREFTQGFHIQNISCEDTNIRYVLSIIKNYEYKPEEYALHKKSVNPVEKKKVKQNLVPAAGIGSEHEENAHRYHPFKADESCRESGVFGTI